MILTGSKEDELFQIDTGAGEPMEQAPSSEPVEVPEAFWRAVKAIGDEKETIPVWETVICHFESLAKSNESAVPIVEELFNKAVACEPPVGSHFKPLYLSWIASAKGTHCLCNIMW